MYADQFLIELLKNDQPVFVPGHRVLYPRFTEAYCEQATTTTIGNIAYVMLHSKEHGERILSNAWLEYLRKLEQNAFLESFFSEQNQL